MFLTLSTIRIELSRKIFSIFYFEHSWQYVSNNIKYRKIAFAKFAFQFIRGENTFQFIFENIANYLRLSTRN